MGTWKFVYKCESRIYLAFPAAENYFALLLVPVSPPEFDNMILEYHRLLKSLPRSDFTRPGHLLQVAGVRSQRWALSGQNSDLDKAITHLTEAVLLPTQRIVYALFHLATLLLTRFRYAKQPDDVKFSIKYFRLLRINFHSLEAFAIPQTSGNLPSNLFRALALKLVFTPATGEMVQDLEDMEALIPEVITVDSILTPYQKDAIEAFGAFAIILTTDMYRHEEIQRVVNRAIETLREATVLNPDLYIFHILGICLTLRIHTTFVMNDFEEAMTVLEKILAPCSPGNNLTPMERNAMMLISVLLVVRMDVSPTPEYLEGAIHRIRAFVPRLAIEDRTKLKNILDAFTYKRSQYFGVSAGTLPNSGDNVAITMGGSARERHEFQRLPSLKDVIIALRNGEITDVDAAVERSRKLVPLQQSRDQWSYTSGWLAEAFAEILVQAYKCTKRLDYLDEAIALYRDLRKISAAPKNSYDMGCGLYYALDARLTLLNLQQDFVELIQLSRELADDNSGTMFTRFRVSYFWAANARLNKHPSTSIAYETAMSLLEEILVFCPTLQTQHHRLTDAFSERRRFPSDYASYWIENGQVKQAIETLERGRALIWSEMRRFRTSMDQLRAANPALADKFADVNRRLESVTTSVAQGNDDERGRSELEAETGPHEHSIGYLVLKQRSLLEERNSLISHIQSLPEFEHFLKPPSFDFLKSAASHGPVIIVNQPQDNFPSHIILLLKDHRPFIISTPSSFNDRANQLENELLRVRKEKGPGSEDYGFTLASILSGLYELVGKSVIERLCELNVPEKSRVWWCPTGVFCSLPLHAMGPIPSDDGKELYFSDLYISSYTSSLSALIESQKRGSLLEASDRSKPSILLVAQPDTLPGAFGEINAIQTTRTQVKTLISAMATPEAVIKGLKDHRFAHFVCHGLLEIEKPFDASLELHKANLTLLEIVRSQLPAAEFAFLAACHTAELTEGSVADEGLHLAASMQYCGFRSVVGTMWAMADMDGADLSKHFYKTIFSDNLKANQNGVPYHERTAGALQIAVKKLRRKRGVTLERWVNFVHYGA